VRGPWLDLGWDRTAAAVMTGILLAILALTWWRLRMREA
jgi:hypothetical protein